MRVPQLNTEPKSLKPTIDWSRSHTANTDAYKARSTLEEALPQLFARFRAVSNITDTNKAHIKNNSEADSGTQAPESKPLHTYKFEQFVEVYPDDSETIIDFELESASIDLNSENSVANEIHQQTETSEKSVIIDITKKSESVGHMHSIENYVSVVKLEEILPKVLIFETIHTEVLQHIPVQNSIEAVSDLNSETQAMSTDLVLIEQATDLPIQNDQPAYSEQSASVNLSHEQRSHERSQNRRAFRKQLMQGRVHHAAGIAADTQYGTGCKELDKVGRWFKKKF